MATVADVMEEFNRLDSAYALRQRLAGVVGAWSEDQRAELLRDVRNKQQTHSTDLHALLSRKVPFALLVEYIGAPSSSPSEETAASVYARLMGKRPGYTRPSLRDKVYYLLLLLGALGLSALVVLNIYGQSGHVSSINIVIGVGVVFIVGMVFDALLWGTFRRSLFNLNQNLTQLSNPLADSLYGFALNEAPMRLRLRHLSPPLAHLLTHLSPHELRVVLLSPPNVVEQVLLYAPPSVVQQQKMLAWTHAYPRYVLAMVGLVLPFGQTRLLKKAAREISSNSV